MTVGYICKLTKGQYELDLSSGRYSLMDFTPPTATELLMMSRGTSANRYRGAGIVGVRGENGTFTFPLRVMGTSQAEVERGVVDLLAFLALSGDESEPLYLDYLPSHYVPYKPVWGQGGWKRLEVIYGTCYRQERYFIGEVRTKAQTVLVELQIKPYAIGLRQKLARATGGVYESYIGTGDRQYNGLSIRGAATNLCNNPIFANPADWDHDWTATDCTLTQNTNPEYILWGQNSARLDPTTAASGTLLMTLTLTAVPWAVTAWMKKPDGSAITATDVKIYYEHAHVDGVYRSIGDGWYMVQATFGGLAAAELIGVEFQSSFQTMYLAGFCVHLGTSVSQMIHGDLLGCTWTGAAHDSTSTRAKSTLALTDAEVFNTISGRGTIRVVVTYEVANTFGADMYLFVGNNARTNLSAYYLEADDKYYFTDGVAAASTAAQTWAIGDTHVLHFVWSPGYKQLYVNGVAGNANATLDQAVWATLFIGGTTAGATPPIGTFKDFTAWDRAFTAAEALADYNNLAPIIADGQAIGEIPYIWDDSGTGLLDQYIDATHNDLAVAGGVSGDMPADTIVYVLNDAVGDGVIIANNPHTVYTSPTAGGVNALYEDEGAHPNDEAGAVGTHVSLNDNPYAHYNANYYDREAYSNKPFAIFMLAAHVDGGVICSLAPSYYYDASASPVTGEKQYWTLATTFKRYLTKTLRTPELSERKYGWVVPGNLNVGFVFTDEATDSAAKLEVDYWRILWGDIASLAPALGANVRYYILHGSQYTALDATFMVTEQGGVRGSPIELYPHKINHLVCLNGAVESASVIADDTTLTGIYITPRYRLL